jgi:hypothetical protein
LTSAKEVRRAAVQVDDSNKVFLLMVETVVATMTAKLSTVPLGALSLLGAGRMAIIPESSSP